LIKHRTGPATLFNCGWAGSRPEEEQKMRGPKRWGALAALLLALALALGVTACGGDDGEEEAAPPAAPEEEPAPDEPIIIGAAVDLTGNMSFFDGPAITAAEIQIERINEEGGVNGRMLELRVIDHQLDPERTRAAAIDLIDQGADILLVTCDVDWATPAVQESIQQGKLTVAPCIGTDQMGPKRFGEQGRLAFSLGNAAQDEGAAMAEYALQQGWDRAVTVTDNVIAYFQNVCEAFTERFTERGGEIVLEESFTQGDGTVQNVVSSVGRHQDADVIAYCSFADDLAAGTAGIRSLGNETPFIGPWSTDGGFWVPEGLSGFWFVTYASVFGDDPNPEVQAMIEEMTARGREPATGGFVTGAATIDAIVAAIEQTGSTDGAALADAFEGFEGLETTSGRVSFTSEWHSVIGREYRVMRVENGEHEFVELFSASSPADIG
jgi:branched-chain amino acid transport system substrate-binding protein